MKLKEFSEILIKRHSKRLATNIIVVGPVGFGLDNLCMAMAESISSNCKKIKFRDENFILQNSLNISNFKDSVVIQRGVPFGINYRYGLHKQTVLNTSLSRANRDIFIFRDVTRDYYKSTLIRYFNYKILIAGYEEIFIEDLTNGEVKKLEFDLKKPNKRAEKLRRIFLENEMDKIISSNDKGGEQ